MKKDIAEKWVAALRSSKYKQGHSVLQNKYGEFCCLGVLCELAVNENIIPPPTMESDRVIYDIMDTTGISSTKIREWSGLQTSLGIIGIINVGSNQLAFMNDNGESFAGIATIIESRYEEL